MATAGTKVPRYYLMYLCTYIGSLHTYLLCSKNKSSRALGVLVYLDYILTHCAPGHTATQRVNHTLGQGANVFV
jgi:hypothetical protein